jgi:hypothetical protein
LSFEANQGQTDARVQYLAHGPGYTLFLTPTEAVFALSGTAASPRPLSPAPSRVEGPPLAASGSGTGSEGAVVHMQLLGSNASAKASVAQRLPGIVNYFIGNDPSKWRTHIPTYGEVQYQDVYPGIGLAYYGNQQQLEYDFQVAPGADPSQIRLEFAGAQTVAVDAGGDLVVQAGGQILLQHKPVVYQNLAGQRRQVMASFLVQGQEVSFALGGYDRSRPLIIDPVLSYSTYLGGSGAEDGHGIAVDAAGLRSTWTRPAMAR